MKGRQELWALAAIITQLMGCDGTWGDLFEDPGFRDAGPALADSGSEACDPDAGSSRCIPGQPGIEEVCRARDGGESAWEPNPCEQGFSCVEGAGCAPCPAKCQAGAITCSADAREVLECKPDPLTGCLDWVSVLVCSKEGLASCELPSPLVVVTETKEYCVNECGGRGISLPAVQCAPAPTLPCAVLVCNADTHLLEPDHTACLGGGLSCQKNSDCASCVCQNSICIGNATRSCSKACF